MGAEISKPYSYKSQPKAFKLFFLNFLLSGPYIQSQFVSFFGASGDTFDRPTTRGHRPIKIFKNTLLMFQTLCEYSKHVSM